MVIDLFISSTIGEKYKDGWILKKAKFVIDQPQRNYRNSKECVSPSLIIDHSNDVIIQSYYLQM